MKTKAKSSAADRRALLALARRVVWFEPPSRALADPDRFLCYLMARPTPDDIDIAARTFSRADFRKALDKAPPGILGPRAWAYWNLALEGHTRRPLPQRFSGAPPLRRRIGRNHPPE